MLQFRVAEHRGYVSKGETDKPTGAHFTMPGHSLADLRVSVIEHTRGRGSEYRKEREHFTMVWTNKSEHWERGGCSLICNLLFATTLIYHNTQNVQHPLRDTQFHLISISKPSLQCLASFVRKNSKQYVWEVSPRASDPYWIWFFFGSEASKLVHSISKLL